MDRGAGHFNLAPVGVTVPISRRYEPGTLIIETTWAAPNGWLVVRDALTMGLWQENPEDEHPPTGLESDMCLVRTATCIDGHVDVGIECLPRFGYGAADGHWEGGELGGARAVSDGLAVELTSDFDLEIDGPNLSGTVSLREDETCFAALCWSDEYGGPRSAPDAAERLEATREFWRSWLRSGRFPDHPWRVYLQHSALVLKGLSHAPTGAFVAAPTTSLPETVGGERNWDYRYCWIRDATFTLWALHTLGFDAEARHFMGFVRDICLKDSNLQIMYGIGGEKDLTEYTLDHLSGYEDSRPVRIGNGAFSQRQNDVWGALLDSIYIHAKALGEPTDHAWELIESQVEAAIAAWEHPDPGIWEARGEPKHYVSSKLMIWVAVDRGRRLAESLDKEGLAGRWSALAERFREEILERGVRDGVFRQHYDTDALDASLLLIPLVRFLPPNDDRVRDTVLAIERDLTRNGLVLRYLVHETDDGLHGEEGTFTICSFWLVSALSEIGEPVRARALCERLIGSAGSLGLFAEEIDPASGRHLGNYPQAFTHLALINAVSHVITDEMRDHEIDDAFTAVFSEMGGVRAGPRY